MTDEELRRELNALTRRLADIERWLGIDQPAAQSQPTRASAPAPRSDITTPLPTIVAPGASPQATQPYATVQPLVALPVEAAIEPPPIATPTVASQAIEPERIEKFRRYLENTQVPSEDFDQEEVLQEASIASAPTTSPPVQPPPIAPLRTRPFEKPETPSPARSLEVLIGGKWMAWVGAIVVVLAAVFAIKVGIDKGWWGRLSPQFRCLAIAGFGGLLMLAGEIALRRIGRAASVGLFGAGLGTLYLDAFATFRFFNLLSHEMAFVLMAVVAVAGFAITLRTRFVTIGVLSLIGGYLTPVLLRGQSTHDLELLSFLTMLLGIALGLSAAMPRHFRPLRAVALGGQIFIGCGWLVANRSQFMLGIVFMSMWWTMLLIECVLAALRRQSGRGNVIAVVIATAAFATGGCWILNSNPPPASLWLGAFTMMIAVLGAAVAFQFGPGIDGLRETPRHAIDRLAVALWAQAGVLLAVAIALQFDHYGQTIGWMVTGLAAIEIGRRLPSRGVTVFGLVVGGLAFARVIIVDWWSRGLPKPPLWTIGQVEITSWGILALATVIATHIAAFRVRARPSGPGPVILATIGSLLWMAICATQADGLPSTAGWLLGAAVLFGMHAFGRRLRYFEIGLFMLLATGVRWLLLDAVTHRMAPQWRATEALPFFNWQMGLALLIAAAGWWAYRIMQNRERESSTAPLAISRNWQFVLLAGAVFGLIAMSFEVDRFVMSVAGPSAPAWWSIGQMRQLLLTLLWTCGTTALGVLAAALRSRDESGSVRVPMLLTNFAWAMLGACALKWIIIDTLFWTVTGNRHMTIAAMPVANVQMLVGVIGAAALFVLWFLNRREDQSADDRLPSTLALSANPTAWMPVATALMILWGLSFEIDRAIGRVPTLPAWLAAWNPAQHRGLWWTALWSLGGLAMMHIGRWRAIQPLFQSGWAIIAMAAGAWLTYDTLAWRIGGDTADATVFFNLQFMVGALVAGLLVHTSAMMLRRSEQETGEDRRQLRLTAQIGFGAVATIALWLGSLEIDRLFINDRIACQTGFSVYWAVFGLLLVLLGFFRLSAAARYSGLGLLAATLMKVLFVDFSGLDDFPRVISFAAAGILLIVTSLVYTKLSPKILALRADARGEAIE